VEVSITNRREGEDRRTVTRSGRRATDPKPRPTKSLEALGISHQNPALVSETADATNDHEA